MSASGCFVWRDKSARLSTAEAAAHGRALCVQHTQNGERSRVQVGVRSIVFAYNSASTLPTAVTLVRGLVAWSQPRAFVPAKMLAFRQPLWRLPLLRGQANMPGKQ